MKRIEDIKEFEDIDTYYGISKMLDEIKEFEDIDTYYGISDIVSEVFKDRVEEHKHLVTANKEIKRLNNIIKEVRKYVENNKQYVELENYGKNGEYYIDEKGLLEILDKGSDKKRIKKK